MAFGTLVLTTPSTGRYLPVRNWVLQPTEGEFIFRPKQQVDLNLTTFLIDPKWTRLTWRFPKGTIPQSPKFFIGQY